MSTKTKKENLASAKVLELAQQVGIVLMTAAVTVGMLDVPDRPKIVLPNQPALALAGENNNEEINNPIRREKEEAAPHFISYNEVQRTPSRSGR